MSPIRSSRRRSRRSPRASRRRHAEPLTEIEDTGLERFVNARIVLDRIEVWQGSKVMPVQLGTVERWVEQASRDYNRARVVLDPWQAVGSAQRLRERGVTVEEFAFNASSVGRLGSVLHALARDRLLNLPQDDALLDELSSVRLRETPSGLRLDHDSGQHDDRAVALALAAATAG